MSGETRPCVGGWKIGVFGPVPRYAAGRFTYTASLPFSLPVFSTT